MGARREGERREAIAPWREMRVGGEGATERAGKRGRVEPFRRMLRRRVGPGRRRARAYARISTKPKLAIAEELARGRLDLRGWVMAPGYNDRAVAEAPAFGWAHRWFGGRCGWLRNRATASSRYSTRRPTFPPKRA